MAEFLTTKGVADEIESIIKNAKNRLVLISSYLQLSETLFQILKDADRREVRITLVYGKGELKPDERSQLKKFDNLSLCLLENLHAKCFFNEECMVITSMNLYDFYEQKNREMGVLISEQKNREMGVLISTKGDESAFRNAVKEAKLIVDSSRKHDLRRPGGDYFYHRNKQKYYCIRCRTVIPYDLKKPLCRDCFSEWEIGGDPNYEEYYCHTCGRHEPATINKPLCSSCYRESLI
ncbi:phospholipase D-like domain-containing protein [Chloroflexota bacterium]